jgi:hypothetical protein
MPRPFRRLATALPLAFCSCTKSKLRGYAADYLDTPPAEAAVVAKARREAAAHRRELIAAVPRIGVRAVADEIAVEVLRE